MLAEVVCECNSLFELRSEVYCTLNCSLLNSRLDFLPFFSCGFSFEEKSRIKGFNRPKDRILLKRLLSSVKCFLLMIQVYRTNIPGDIGTS